jgi:hypothetical protein
VKQSMRTPMSSGRAKDRREDDAQRRSRDPIPSSPRAKHVDHGGHMGRGDGQSSNILVVAAVVVVVVQAPPAVSLRGFLMGSLGYRALVFNSL